MELTATTPYLIRAIHEWCEDNGLTPHLLVVVTAQTYVPMAYVKEGEIVLNISYGATQHLTITNEHITFSARFGGKSEDIYIPIEAVKGIFSKEDSQGMFFEVQENVPVEPPENVIEAVPSSKEKPLENNGHEKKSKKPTLKVVK